MNKSLVLFLLFIYISISLGYAQQDTLKVNIVDAEKQKNKTQTKVIKDVAEYDPLAPARAAFYSAILPGLGQAYNKQYWKIPIAYAGIGGSIYYYIRNDREYTKFRNAYKRRLAGFEDDEFFDLVSDDSLIEGQQFYQRNKEISLLVAVGFYVLNIVDANVTAHLRQFNVSEDLSLEPDFNWDELQGKPNYGLSLNYKF